MKRSKQNTAVPSDLTKKVEQMDQHIGVLLTVCEIQNSVLNALTEALNNAEIPIPLVEVSSEFMDIGRKLNEN